MNSSQLNRFINKYHLGGEIKSVKWASDGNSLTTRFISGDKSVLGEVKLDNFDGVQASELGVYNTPQLASLLNILSEDVEFKLINAGDKFISIDMVDQRYKTDTFTVVAKNDEVNVVIGYSGQASNRVTIPVEVSEFKEIEPVSFNANMFSNILTANKECETATLKISSQGLSKINFKIDDYTSEYYLVASQQVT